LKEARSWKKKAEVKDKGKVGCRGYSVGNYHYVNPVICEISNSENIG
jgi:hypothetical protein